MVVLNTSNQQYFLLDRQIKNAEDMVQFINNILDGTVEVSCSLPFQRDDGRRERRNELFPYDSKWKSCPLSEGTGLQTPCFLVTDGVIL